MTLNVGDDMITTWYTRDFPNWLNGLGHTRVKAIAGNHVEDAAYVVSLNGTAGKVIDIDAPVNVVKRLRQTLLMRTGASIGPARSRPVYRPRRRDENGSR